MDIHTQITQNISSFPALSSVVSEVYQTCSDPNSSIANLVKIIEKDQGLTIDILRSTNSPIYGFTREIVSINQAVALFGMGTIKGFAISSMLRNSVKFDLSPYGLGVEGYMDTCRAYNKFVMEVFKNEIPQVKDVIFPASFLMLAGTLILSSEAKKALPQADLAAFSEAVKKSDETAAVEKEMLGVSGVETTAMLFKHWNFDADLIAAIRGVVDEASATPLSLPLKAAIKSLNFYRKYSAEQIQATKDFMVDNFMQVDFDKFEKFAISQAENLKAQG